MPRKESKIMTDPASVNAKPKVLDPMNDDHWENCGDQVKALKGLVLSLQKPAKKKEPKKK